MRFLVLCKPVSVYEPRHSALPSAFNQLQTPLCWSSNQNRNPLFPTRSTLTSLNLRRGLHLTRGLTDALTHTLTLTGPFSSQCVAARVSVCTTTTMRVHTAHVRVMRMHCPCTHTLCNFRCAIALTMHHS